MGAPRSGKSTGGKARGRSGPGGGGGRARQPAAASDSRGGGGGRGAGRASGPSRGAASASGGGRGRGRGGSGRPSPVRKTSSRGVGGDQVEGRQAVRELLIAGNRKVREIYVSADLDGADIIDEILELAEETYVPIREIGRSKLDSIAKTDAPQGIVAIADELTPIDLDEMCQTRDNKVPFLLALDGVTDPRNLGALLRSAECAGVTGVILPRHRSVHVTATVSKTAAGAIEHLPFTLVGGLPTAIDQMRKLGVWSVGLDETGPKTLWELDALDSPIVLVLGAEGRGLSRLVRQRCDQIARIPMEGRLASLNVSVAGALACFEITRFRQQHRQQRQ